MNAYCTITQLYDLYDLRAIANLSNDTNSGSPLTARIQNLLDLQAAELESYLTGRVALPLSTVSLVLTKWVAVTTAARLYGRRADKPKEIEGDEHWAKDWLELFMARRVGLPLVEWAAQPELVDSDEKNGSSEFDYAFGTGPSTTGPTGDGSPVT